MTGPPTALGRVGPQLQPTPISRTAYSGATVGGVWNQQKAGM